MSITSGCVAAARAALFTLCLRYKVHKKPLSGTDTLRGWPQLQEIAWGAVRAVVAHMLQKRPHWPNSRAKVVNKAAQIPAAAAARPHQAAAGRSLTRLPSVVCPAAGVSSAAQQLHSSSSAPPAGQREQQAAATMQLVSNALAQVRASLGGQQGVGWGAVSRALCGWAGLVCWDWW